VQLVLKIIGLWYYSQRSKDYDEMIACDGKDCANEWFHWSRMDLTEETAPIVNGTVLTVQVIDYFVLINFMQITIDCIA